MRIAIMQPYLFPYIGYWQLVNCVDTFVFFDDVNYIKRGYINRNTIVVDGKEHLFTLPINNASQNKLINELTISREHKIVETIERTYCKSPYFGEVFELVEDVFQADHEELHLFISNSIIKIAEFLDINTKWKLSSNVNKPDGLRGQEKILAICKSLGAYSYVNAIGGQELYQKDKFSKEGISLGFIQCNSSVPRTSIIDLLMTLGRTEVKKALEQYEVI